MALALKKQDVVYDNEFRDDKIPWERFKPSMRSFSLGVGEGSSRVSIDAMAANAKDKKKRRIAALNIGGKLPLLLMIWRKGSKLQFMGHGDGLSFFIYVSARTLVGAKPHYLKVKPHFPEDSDIWHKSAFSEDTGLTIDTEFYKLVIKFDPFIDKLLLFSIEPQSLAEALAKTPSKGVKHPYTDNNNKGAIRPEALRHEEQDLTWRGKPRVNRPKTPGGGNTKMLSALIPEELKDRFSKAVKDHPTLNQGTALEQAVEDFLDKLEAEK